jgi:hypothetical protein
MIVGRNQTCLNRLSDDLKKSELTLSQRILKKGDVNDDANDGDKVRTSTSHTVTMPQQH